jgi:hypothetical protein
VNSALLNDSPNYSISFWLRSRAHTANAGLVFARQTKTGGIAYNNSTDGRMISYAPWSPGLQLVVTPSGFSLNEWIHIGVVCFSSGGRRGIVTYTNGIQAAFVDTGTESTIEQSSVFLIGYDSAIAARKTDGIFDEVAIHNRALSSNEVYRIATEQLIYRKP